jgi:hypothetical protein
MMKIVWRYGRKKEVEDEGKKEIKQRKVKVGHNALAIVKN